MQSIVIIGVTRNARYLITEIYYSDRLFHDLMVIMQFSLQQMLIHSDKNSLMG